MRRAAMTGCTAVIDCAMVPGLTSAVGQTAWPDNLLLAIDRLPNCSRKGEMAAVFSGCDSPCKLSTVATVPDFLSGSSQQRTR